MKKIYLVIFGILLLALILRIYNLTGADVITDEALIAFRSIGYIDFFASPDQTTPMEWFSDVPGWAKISFHDHPPLVFLIQHFFFKVLGQNIITLRLPFVLAGLGSVLLLYFIGQELFNRQIGLIASLLLAVSSYHVWISRIGLQESLVILFSLLAFYLFIKALETKRYWPWWGIALGLALLTKHNTLILLPIFSVYLLIFHRPAFKDKRFWLALILALVIFSPAIIYNLKLYQARGHFDLQFSYLLGQPVLEWQSLPGKEQIGDFNDRLKNLIPALYRGMLWPMFILFVAAFGLVIYKFFKEGNWLRSNSRVSLLILTILSYFGFYLLIGPTKRFVVVVVPFIVLLIAWLVSRWPKVVKYSTLVIIIVLEIFFSINTLLTYRPIGREGLTYSYLNIESYNWGYNQLNTYLVQLLKGKRPEMTFETRYQFLEDIKASALVRAEKEKLKPTPILLIYDGDMYDLATLWLFHRRMVYQGWPIITADGYLEENQKFWSEQGVNDFYFFKIIDSGMLQKPVEESTGGATALAEQLKDIKPEIIKRPDGREAFAVYHWTD